MQVEFEYVMKLTTWDAREAYPDGFGDLDGEPEQVADLAEKLGRVVATGGTVMVLPGPEAHQALVITCEGDKEITLHDAASVEFRD